MDGTGNERWLLADGHGSTRGLVDGNATLTDALNYDAFAGALNFSATSPPTVFLFGGDAVYDPASGAYLHGNGIRGRLGSGSSRWMSAAARWSSRNITPILRRYILASASVTGWPNSRAICCLIWSMLIRIAWEVTATPELMVCEAYLNRKATILATCWDEGQTGVYFP